MKKGPCLMWIFNPRGGRKILSIIWFLPLGVGLVDLSPPRVLPVALGQSILETAADTIRLLLIILFKCFY